MSWWPFGGADNSAASFEKILSQLATKIKSETARDDKLRHRQRKYKVLWTMYAAFTYILISAIFVLIYGWESWGMVEWTVVAGGAPFIYSIRAAIDSYYSWRIQGSEGYLTDLHKQRETTIEKLKSATKYDDTHQILEKYGGSPRRKQGRQPSPQPPSKESGHLGKRQFSGETNRQSWPQGGRTNLAPPATANIPSKQPPPPAPPANAPPPRPASIAVPPISEEFAPNAFDRPQAPQVRPPMPTRPSQYATGERKWYDRVLDVMLGEDEAQAKSRIVLICENCRLVNGQAPPGVRTLEDIGRWRCGSCHAWNGVEREEATILKRIVTNEEHDNDIKSESPLSAEDGEEEGDSDAEPAASLEREGTPADSTRSKTRQRSKA